MNMKSHNGIAFVDDAMTFVNFKQIIKVVISKSMKERARAYQRLKMMATSDDFNLARILLIRY